jgi:hypothetical protein
MISLQLQARVQQEQAVLGRFDSRKMTYHVVLKGQRTRWYQIDKQ